MIGEVTVRTTVTVTTMRRAGWLVAGWTIASPAFAMAAAEHVAPVAPAVIEAGVVDDPCAPALLTAMAPADPLQRDFGGLCRYRAANAALLDARQPVDTVFFGDSITELWGRLNPALFAPGVINRGISGQTTAQMLVRFRQDVIALHPRVVHILAGTNDIAGNTGPTTLTAIEGNIVSMAELARANGIRVVIGAVLPASAYPWRPQLRPAATIRALNVFLRDYARAERLGFVDYYTPFANAAGGMDPTDAEDGVHPSRSAYERMSVLARQAIAR